MANVTKPTTYLNWTDGSGSKVTQPPPTQQLSGWTAGEAPPFQYMNWLFYITDQWIQYLDQETDQEASNTNLNASMRLINGGNWSYVNSTGVLTWSSAFNLAVPGIADADNQAAAGSATLTDGQIAYVTANIPFSATGTTTNSSNQLTNMSYTIGITVGMTVTGTGIPGSTTVTAISGSTLTISNNATASGTVTLTFSSTGALTVSVATSSSFVVGPTTIVIARRVGSKIYLGVNAIGMIIRDGELKLIYEDGYLNTVVAPSGGTLAANTPVYMSPGTGIDSALTAGSLYSTDAGSTNGALRSQFLGFIQTSVTGVVASTVVVTGGIMGGFSGLTQGAIYYLNPSVVGGITATRPTTANQYLAPIGVAISATQIYMAPTATSQIIAAVGVGMGAADTLAINPSTQSPYTMTTGNNGQVLLINSLKGPCQLNLPTPAANLIFTVKDVGGLMSTANCTLHRNASENIEGLAADYIMQANFGQWTFSCDGTNWIRTA